jgi:ABC-type glycerol-3-phosphate transport system substrate-binding protein
LQGVTLRIACPADTPAEVVRQHSRSWAARHAARIEVVRFNRQETPPDADVWIIPPAQLPRWAASGKLQPMPEGLTTRDSSYGWTNLLPQYREQLLVWDRVVYGLPLVGESFLCCYRSDLIQDAAHQKRFQQQYQRKLAPPASWEEFADLADYFREHHPAGKPGPSLPPLPADDESLDRQFYTIAAGFARRAIAQDEAQGEDHLDEVFSFHFNLQTGQPRIDTPGFVHALNVLRRLQACRPEEAAAEPARAFQSGQAVLCLTDASWLAAFQKEPALRDKVGIAPIPGGDRTFAFATGTELPVKAGRSNRVPYLGSGGWLAVVPRSSSNSEAAFGLLAELTGPETSAQIALEPRWGGGPTREEHINRQRWDAFDLDQERTLALREALRGNLFTHGLKNPVICLRTPDEASYRAALDTALRAALGKTAVPPAEALATAARAWEKLNQARGPAHLAEYRLSLGLRADTR